MKLSFSCELSPEKLYFVFLLKYFAEQITRCSKTLEPQEHMGIPSFEKQQNNNVRCIVLLGRENECFSSFLKCILLHNCPFMC